MGAHIASFLILCRPQNVARVRQALAALPEVETHDCDAEKDGKIVALAQGGDEDRVGETLNQLQNLPGVIAANMVYHGIDYGHGAPSAAGKANGNGN